MFRGMGQRVFLVLPSTGHKDFLCFYGGGLAQLFDSVLYGH